jgi:polyferredoxin
MDLFKIGWLRGLYKNHWFPLIPQVLVLAFFGYLVCSGLGVSTDDPDFAKILRNTNLSNLIVWSYWFPLIVIGAVLLGRHWCTICPIELVTSLAGRIGRRRKAGRFLKSGWAITTFYSVILVLGVQTFAIHRIPQRMAVYMLVLLGVAVLSGLIWERRTFCSHICPVGHLLGLYSLLSSAEWRVGNPQTCSECKTKDCIAKSRLYNLTVRSCTSDLYPAKIKDNRRCILCSQCYSSCPYDNPGLRLRRPLKDLFSDLRLSAAEIAFIILVSGFVVYEILSEWSTTKAMLVAMPNAISSYWGITGVWTGTVKAVVLFMILPVVFFAVFAGIRRLAGDQSIRRSLESMSIAILPIMGSMHVLKAILKMTSRIPYWPQALADRRGIHAAQALANGSAQLNKAILETADPYITGIGVALPAVGFGLAAWVISRRSGDSRSEKFITLMAALIYAAVFEASIIAWRL